MLDTSRINVRRHAEQLPLHSLHLSFYTKSRTVTWLHSCIVNSINNNFFIPKRIDFSIYSFCLINGPRTGVNWPRAFYMAVM